MTERDDTPDNVVDIDSARKEWVEVATDINLDILPDVLGERRIFLEAPPEGQRGWGLTAEQARGLRDALDELAQELEPDPQVVLVPLTREELELVLDGLSSGAVRDIAATALIARLERSRESL